MGNAGTVEVRMNSDRNDGHLINVAYIPQKDTLFGLLTVRESILFSTKMLISKKIHEKQFIEPVIDQETKKKYVATDSKFCDVLCSNIIKELGLDVCEHNRVNACSGGQHKRYDFSKSCLPLEV